MALKLEYAVSHFGGLNHAALTIFKTDGRHGRRVTSLAQNVFRGTHSTGFSKHMFRVEGIQGPIYQTLSLKESQLLLNRAAKYTNVGFTPQGIQGKFLKRNSALY